MLALDPRLKVIFVKRGPTTFEKAFLSQKHLANGRRRWTFYAVHRTAVIDLLPDGGSVQHLAAYPAVPYSRP